MRTHKSVLIASFCALVVGAGVTRAWPASRATARWQAWGLPGETVHALIDIRSGQELLAATEHGVFAREGRRWRKLLSDRSVWGLDSARSGRVVAAVDDAGDLLLSLDGGRHWSRRRVERTPAYVVKIRPGTTSDLLVGTADALMRTRDAGAHWARVAHSSGSGFDAVVWSRDRSPTVYAAEVAGSADARPRIYSSADGGSTWTVYGRGNPSPAGTMALAITRHRLLAGTMGRAVWSASKQSSRWLRSSKGMPPQHDHVAALFVSDGESLLAAGTEGFGAYVSDDCGVTWQSSSGLRGDAAIVLSLAYDAPFRTLLAGTADGIYRLRQPVPSRLSCRAP